MIDVTIDPVNEIRHHFTDYQYAKEIRLKKDGVVFSHKHEYDHFSFLSVGIAEVTVDGIKSMHFAGDLIVIKSHSEHTIKAITPVIWFCIHATDEKDIDKIDSVIIGG